MPVIDASAVFTAPAALAADSVNNAILADMAANTVKGAVAAGNPVDLTPAQVRAIIGSDNAANTTSFLRADGTLAVPPGTGGAIAAGSIGTTELAADGVTNAIMADMAANTVKGAVVAGNPVDLTPAQVRTLIGSDNAANTTDFLRADGTLAVPPAAVDTTGRLGRFGGTTTGPLAASTGIFEAADGRIGVGTTTPQHILQSVSTGTVSAISGSITATGTASAVTGEVAANGSGNGVTGITSGGGAGHGVHGVNSGAGAGNGVLGTNSGGGTGNGVHGTNTGGGAGNGVQGTKTGAGTGNGVVANNSGSGNGSGLLAQVLGTGNGHGTTSVVLGAGNGHGLYCYVGALAGATGTGDALNAAALNAPGTGSHTAAVRGTVVTGAQWAGYFSGNVHATGTMTSSDIRIKSDIVAVSQSLIDTVGRLPINTYYKHIDGRASDVVTGDMIKQLEEWVADIDNLPSEEVTQSQKEDRARFIAEIEKFHAEDWLSVKGSKIPGRLAGVIAQEVEAVAPEYVVKAGKPFQNGPDLEPIRTVNDSSILYIMVETLRHDMAKLSAEFAAYRATHP